MAATSTANASGFSVERWLKAIGLSMYTTAFTTHGHVNYERCLNLSEEDIRALVGVTKDTSTSHGNVLGRLVNRVKELRKLSEEDAVKLLVVSTQ